jgi:hypothetical protein
VVNITPTAVTTYLKYPVQSHHMDTKEEKAVMSVIAPYPHMTFNANYSSSTSENKVDGQRRSN